NNSAYNNWNGFSLGYSSNNTLTNNYAYSNSRYGFYLPLSSNYNTLTNNYAYNNRNGFSLEYSSNYNTLTNNYAYNNWNGFSLGYSSNYNTLTNNSAYNNVYFGFSVSLNSNYNILTNNSAYNNSRYGLFLDATGGLLLTDGLLLNATNFIYVNNDHYYKNSEDIKIVGPATVNLTKVIIDNPAGNYQNYTILSLNDKIALGETYYIKWTTNSTALPFNHFSFANKFIEISTDSGTLNISTDSGTPIVSVTPIIDYIAWHWLDSELSGYDETKFELWKYNSSGWTMLNNSPDTTNNKLSLSNMDPESDYGILYNYTPQPPGGGGGGCDSGLCKPIECINYECCNDSDCNESYKCINHECVPPMLEVPESEKPPEQPKPAKCCLFGICGEIFGICWYYILLALLLAIIVYYMYKKTSSKR
ncbi:MAG: right-handed parallel beta-helix repeat-containing protein, partial [Candidatus Micrarchaeia archaeon]